MSHVWTILLALTAIGLFVTGIMFLTASRWALERFGHRPTEMAPVIGGRYVSWALFALLAVFSGNPDYVAATFAIFALAGFWDLWVYAQDGYPRNLLKQHLRIAVLAGIVALLAWLWQ